MQIIITLFPAALLLSIMYFTSLYTAEESMRILAAVFIGSVISLLIAHQVKKINK